MATLLGAGALGAGGVALVTLALRCLGAGGGGAPCCLGGHGGGGFFLAVADDAEDVLPPLVAFSSLLGIGMLGGGGNFFEAKSLLLPLSFDVDGGAAPRVEEGRRKGIEGNGLDGARLKDGLLSNEGGGGGFFPPGGGGGFFDVEPFGVGVGGGAAFGAAFGDMGGGGGGLGDIPPPASLLPGLDFIFGGATGGVVGVDGGIYLASFVEPRFVRWTDGVGLEAVLESPSNFCFLLGGGGGGLMLLTEEESSGSVWPLSVLALSALSRFGGLSGGGLGDSESEPLVWGGDLGGGDLVNNASPSSTPDE